MERAALKSRFVVVFVSSRVTSRLYCRFLRDSGTDYVMEKQKKEFGHRQDAQLLPPEASANSLLIRNLFSLAPAARRFQDGNEEKSSRVLVLGPKRNPFSLETLATTFQPLLIRDMSAGRQHPTENQSARATFSASRKNTRSAPLYERNNLLLLCLQLVI